MAKTFKISKTAETPEITRERILEVRNGIYDKLQEMDAHPNEAMNVMLSIIGSIVHKYVAKNERKNMIDGLKYVLEDIVLQLEEDEK